MVVFTKNLRPAVCVRLIRAEERQDHVVYVIWVMDVKSGVEWYVRRRFREFYEFREVSWDGPILRGRTTVTNYHSFLIDLIRILYFCIFYFSC
jgi:hypothetical protein